MIRQGTNDSYKLDGTFGQHFAIRSLPERVIEQIINKNTSYHESNLSPSATGNNESYSQTVHHLMIYGWRMVKILREI